MLVHDRRLLNHAPVGRRKPGWPQQSGHDAALTHTGAAAALDAVNGLPFVLGEAPKALPSPARTVDAETVRKLAEDMTPQTWRNLRAELLALATCAP